MLVVQRSKHFYKNIALLRQSFYTGCPNLISDKAFEKLKLKQAKMQCEDGRPVYLKCGFRDKVLYWLTLGLTMYSSFQSFKFVYKCYKDDEY